MKATRKTWIAGAAVVAILILVAVWLLLITPVRDESAIANDDAEQIEYSNDVLSTRVATLRKQFEKIDEYKDQLSAYQVQIPTAVDYESIVDEIERSVEKSKVSFISVSSEENIAPVKPFTELVVAEPTGTESEEGEASAAQAPTEPVTVSGATPTATGALSTVVPGFYQVPLLITVQGDYEEVLEFSEQLQVNSERALLVTSVEVTSLREAPESANAPKSEVGDVTYILHTIAYVLQSEKAGAVPDGSDITETVLPEIGRKNVFAPER
ncbi:hypothetical protein [Timonella senegalensis]|uniref:hypothetical protein n=1 Tax=Timonella senegalensis TaxID=1465825 RepID=UPI002FDE8A1B